MARSFASIVRAVGTVVQSPKFLWNSDPSEYYRYLGDDVVEGQNSGFVDDKPLWLNLGYWKEARVYPDAARALATKLADAAELGPNDELLDLGFGFGEQDIFWAETYGVRRIHGLNVTPSQVERARARVEQRALSERVDLQLGSATELPFAEGSFDKITALECAHHFDTRQKFFEEAFRVLRPGGRLATADGVGSAGKKLSFVNRMALRRWCVPLDNVYDRDEYCRRLASIGFVDIRCESIRNYVFPGCIKYQELRQRGIPMQDAVVDLTDEDFEKCTGLELFELTGLSDYVIVSAMKPAAGTGH